LLDAANTASHGAPKLTLSIAGSWGYESAYVSCGGLGNVSLLVCAVSHVSSAEYFL
jgi:hypothetical protein